MARVNLKRLVGRKKEASSIINHLISAMDTSIVVKDADGQLLLGVDDENPTDKYPVELEGETLGWVIGGKQAAAVASLLIYLLPSVLMNWPLAQHPGTHFGSADTRYVQRVLG